MWSEHPEFLAETSCPNWEGTALYQHATKCFKTLLPSTGTNGSVWCGLLWFCVLDHSWTTCWAHSPWSTFLQWESAAIVEQILPESNASRNSYSKTSWCQQQCSGCGKPESFDNMIECESGHCKVGWYHFKCVGLKSAPKGSWTCLPCRRMPPLQEKQTVTKQLLTLMMSTFWYTF